MLDYKKLLGDKYKDGLSDTELLALLNELNLADLSSGEYVAKGKFDARESEIANLKKAIADYQEKENANLTDAQKRDLAYKSLEESNQKLAKEIEQFKLKETIMASGYSADECAKIIDAQNKGENVAAIYADIMKARTEEAVKSAKAEMTKTKTPPPPQGKDNLGDEDDAEVAFVKQLAQSNLTDNKSIDAVKGAYSGLRDDD